MEQHGKKIADASLSQYEINTDFYDWAVNSFRRVEKMLGLNIKVHSTQPDLLQNGQIFVFNHFARFETVIPHYIIHRQTGQYTRAVADHHLFEINPRLTKFLCETGVVPNNLPGLLPFLAAEILRGRKVVIFPEGGMIKDRRVVDDEGQLNILSPQKDTYRKHHRGAAVLAVMLELFKKRIRQVCESNDARRIEHWRSSLGLASEEELMEQASKLTRIVPGNITFYPIRIDDNILTRGMEFFSRRPSGRAWEELVVEGNLLLKNTDMDIRLNAPIVPDINWRWWNRMIMERYFDQVDSLDELFGLRETASRWTERLFVSAISKETTRLRDQYMQRIYEGISVNMAHLASMTIKVLMDRGEKSVTFSELARVVYLALKTLQHSTDVYLHRSLQEPDRYLSLVESESQDLRDFLETAIKAGLLEKDNDLYIFLPKLAQEHDFHNVRIENPVLVSVNEVAPIKEVEAAVKKALEEAQKPQAKLLSPLLLDDEKHAYQWSKQHFSKVRYEEINAKEKTKQSAAPYLLGCEGEPAKVGVLLVHGFLSSPAELKDYAQHLKKKGYVVLGIRLPGHGTSPWDLLNRTSEEWQAAVQRGYRILCPLVDEIVVVGFSMGGALSLMFATEKPQGLKGVVAVCPSVAVHKNMMFVPLVNKINAVASWLTQSDGVVPFYPSSPENPDINYHTIPVKALNEFRGVMKSVVQRAKDVTLPTCIVQADEDPVIVASEVEKLAQKIAAKEKSLVWIKAKRHTVMTHNDDNIWQVVDQFIERVTGEEA